MYSPRIIIVFISSSPSQRTNDTSKCETFGGGSTAHTVLYSNNLAHIDFQNIRILIGLNNLRPLKQFTNFVFLLKNA